MKKIFIFIIFLLISNNLLANTLDYKGLEKLSKYNTFMDNKGKPYSISEISDKAQTIKQKLPKGFQRSEFLLEKGYEVHGIKRFNNVEWAKNPDGTPDIGELKRFLEGYVERARLFIEKELADFCYDFVISDLVYEAFEVAAQAGVPAFGVATAVVTLCWSKTLRHRKSFLESHSFTEGMRLYVRT